MTDMREIYLIHFLDPKFGPNISRNWQKSRKNLVHPKFDEAERKEVQKRVSKKCARAFFH